MTVAVCLALVAAVLFGTGTALQAHAASSVRSGGTPSGVVSAGSLARTASRPLWLAGTALDWLGALTHLAALHAGPLTLVQPLTLTAIVVAVPAEAFLRRHRPTRRQTVAAVQTAAGLVVLAVRLGRDLVHGGTGWGPAGATVAALAVAGTLVAASRSSSTRLQALLTGAAAGTCYGLSDALFRVVLGPGATPGLGWALVLAGALGAGGAGLVLTQAALHKGRLASSMPAQDLLALTVSIGLGAALLGELPRLGELDLVLVPVATAAVLLGIRRLSDGDHLASLVPEPQRRETPVG